MSAVALPCALSFCVDIPFMIGATPLWTNSWRGTVHYRRDCGALEIDAIMLDPADPADRPTPLSRSSSHWPPVQRAILEKYRAHMESGAER